jgi:hypothetical protein
LKVAKFIAATTAFSIFFWKVLEGFKDIYSSANLTVDRDIETLSEFYTLAIAGNITAHAYAAYCGICIQDSIKHWFYKERMLSAYVGPEYVFDTGLVCLSFEGADPGQQFWYSVAAGTFGWTAYAINDNGKINISMPAPDILLTTAGANDVAFGIKLSDGTYDVITSSIFQLI